MFLSLWEAARVRVKLLSTSMTPELAGKKTSVKIVTKWYYGSFYLQLGPGANAMGAHAGAGCSAPRNASQGDSCKKNSTLPCLCGDLGPGTSREGSLI